MGLSEHVLRTWETRYGLKDVLACPPRELHDLGPMKFGIALQRVGWRVGYLGTDTPVDTLLETTGRLGPDLVVLSATGAAPNGEVGAVRE